MRVWKSNWVFKLNIYVILNDIGLIIKDCLVLKCDEVKTYGVIGRFKASDGTPWNPDIRDAMNCQYFFNGYKIPWIWAMIHTLVYCRAYRKAGYLTMVIAGYIPANSQLAAAIATIVKSLSIGK